MGGDPIILQAVLIGLNAVFASAEIAVISMNDTKLKKLIAEGNPKAEKLSALTGQPAKFLPRYRWQLPWQAYWEALLQQKTLPVCWLMD